MKKWLYKNRQLICGILAGLACYAGLTFVRIMGKLPIYLGSESNFIASWNVALLTYLSMTFYMMVKTPNNQINLMSKDGYEKKRVMLTLAIVASINSIVAIIKELGVASQLEGMQQWFHVGLTMSTIVLSWMFTHTLFALYYAHFFYHEDHDDSRPLDFPCDSKPDYFDFIYFAFGIGVAGQSSDVDFTNKTLRRVGTVHSMIAYFFNTMVLALLIDMAGNLFHPG